MIRHTIASSYAKTSQPQRQHGDNMDQSSNFSCLHSPLSAASTPLGFNHKMDALVNTSIKSSPFNEQGVLTNFTKIPWNKNVQSELIRKRYIAETTTTHYELMNNYRPISNHHIFKVMSLKMQLLTLVLIDFKPAFTRLENWVRLCGPILNWFES